MNGLVDNCHKLVSFPMVVIFQCLSFSKGCHFQESLIGPSS